MQQDRYNKIWLKHVYRCGNFCTWLCNKLLRTCQNNRRTHYTATTSDACTLTRASLIVGTWWNKTHCGYPPWTRTIDRASQWQCCLLNHVRAKTLLFVWVNRAQTPRRLKPRGIYQSIGIKHELDKTWYSVHTSSGLAVDSTLEAKPLSPFTI